MSQLFLSYYCNSSTTEEYIWDVDEIIETAVMNQSRPSQFSPLSYLSKEFRRANFGTYSQGLCEERDAVRKWFALDLKHSKFAFGGPVEVFFDISAVQLAKVV